MFLDSIARRQCGRRASLPCKSSPLALRDDDDGERERQEQRETKQPRESLSLPHSLLLCRQCSRDGEARERGEERWSLRREDHDDDDDDDREDDGA